MERESQHESTNHEAFVRHLTENQTRLYGYVYSLLGDHSLASDVVQETNLVLWRKIAEFAPEKPFLPWAFAIARFQVLAHIRDKKRDRVLLDAELVEAISGEVEKQATQMDAFRDALRPCIQKLTPNNRDLVERRYFKAMTVNQLAETFDRTTAAIKVALVRIRRQLGECVEQQIASEGQR
ncbi:sigma-70 family RNA polymerase sigma factor [Roseiconus lacunae]|nr:sigma-70 family RNA polymerase sigma factor [Roseiconus lacunae]MCD0462361.1 sigma-70 family RNA polymerase sigma factor [Roseiconus lacunae]